MGFFSELFKTETEEERQYREFLETKSKEFISIIPNGCFEEFISYDISQFKSVKEKIDFMFQFFEDIELRGCSSRKCMEHFFKKEYSQIECYLYDLRDKGNEFLKIYKTGVFITKETRKAEIKIFEDKILIRFLEKIKDNSNGGYGSRNDSDTYDRGSFLFQKQTFNKKKRD